MFRLRLDAKSDLNVPDYIKTTGATAYVLVHHVLPHGNPHYHAYLELDIKEPALRQRIKRLGYSASDFSIKKCDKERKNEYIQYLFNQKHGNVATLIDTYNIDSELLDRLQIQASHVAEEYQRNTDTKRNSKLTVYQLSQEIKEIVEKRFTRNNLLGIIEEIDQIPFPDVYKYALETSIKICHKYNQPFEENYLRRLTVTAISYLNVGRQGIIDKIMQREFYSR